MARLKPPQAQYIIALKCMYKKELTEGKLELQVRREVEIQMNLRHPHILRLFGYFHDTGRIFLMLELAAQGEMYKYMNKIPDRRFAEPQAARVSRGTVVIIAIAQRADCLATPRLAVRSTNDRRPLLSPLKTCNPPRYQAGKPLTRRPRRTQNR